MKSTYVFAQGLTSHITENCTHFCEVPRAAREPGVSVEATPHLRALARCFRLAGVEGGAGVGRENCLQGRNTALAMQVMAAYGYGMARRITPGKAPRLDSGGREQETKHASLLHQD